MPTYRVNVPFKVEAEDATEALQKVYNIVSTAALAGLDADDGVISSGGLRLADLVHEVPGPTEPMEPAERVAAMERLAVAWSLGHPERLDKSRQFVMAAVRDGGLRCRYCRLDLFFYDSLNVLDHVVPLSRGGGHGDDNVVVACRDCNRLKGQYVPVGGPFGARVADADREIRERRAARIDQNHRGLLERLIGGGQR
jgi:5-methylcytosine-specific restriction endonuclease McrA